MMPIGNLSIGFDPLEAHLAQNRPRTVQTMDTHRDKGRLSAIPGVGKHGFEG